VEDIDHSRLSSNLELLNPIEILTEIDKQDDSKKLVEKYINTSEDSI
jgi:hypothetical protein